MERILPVGRMLLGTLLMALGLNLFLRPAGIFSGGIPGMAVILLHVIGTSYTSYFGVIVFSLQALFILAQVPYFGFRKTLKGVITSVTFSVMTQITVAPTMEIHVSDNLLVMSIGGSALMGLGISQVLLSGYRFVGSLGVAEILSDKLGIPTGRSILYLEGLIVLAGACIIGVKQAMVSILGIFVMSRTIDVFTAGKHQNK
jgi:uncharacterized membrane-anchored protein YitT (DUF2179 family)